MNAQEYQEQLKLANENPQRHPPILEMTSLFHSRRFNENHIGRIAADAYAHATGNQPSNQAQHRFEYATKEWNPEQKISFMQDAAEHWLPPYGHEISRWYTTRQDAMAFLDKHPQIEALMDDDDDDNDPKAAAKTALQTIEELERIMNQPDNSINSIEWKMKWKAMKKTLAAIAED